MDKTIQKKIKAISKLLPANAYQVNEKVEIIGQDLLLSGHKKVNGEKVDPEKMYLMDMPVYFEKNHYRRFKKAFQKSGSEGVKKYLKGFVKDFKKLCLIVDVIFKGRVKDGAD